MVRGVLISAETESTSSVRAEVSVQEMLGMMDVANALQQQQKEVERQLSHDEQVGDLKERLYKTYQAMGKPVDDALLERAIQDHFSHKYEFVPPKRDIGYALAKAYVERARLGRRYGVPALVIAGVIGAGYGILQAGKLAYIASQESKIEEAVVDAYQRWQQLELNQKGLSSSPFVGKLPDAEKRELSDVVQRTARELQSWDPFFNEFCPRGNAQDGVTRENYETVEPKLKPLGIALKDIGADLQRGNDLLEREKQFQLIRRDLDTAFDAFKKSQPLEVFVAQAENAYHAGIQNVDSRLLAPAQGNLQTLRGVQENSRQFTSLSAQVERLYVSVTEAAREDGAKKKAAGLYQSARQYIKEIDVTRLRSMTQELQGLHEILNQEYELRIVSREGVRSGIDRYYTDEKGKRLSGVYLIVEAVGLDGNPIFQNITSEETGKTEQVQMWGERVPGEVYQKIKNDKLDDGIVQDSILGKKRRGYLQPHYEARFSLQSARITKW